MKESCKGRFTDYEGRADARERVRRHHLHANWNEQNGRTHNGSCISEQTSPRYHRLRIQPCFPSSDSGVHLYALSIGIIVVAVIGAIVWVVGKPIDSVGGAVLVAILIFFIAGIVYYNHLQKKRRIAYLLEKYGDETIVQHILQRRFWHGQTAPQLLDSLGSPLSIDKKSMATRRREVWKYNSRGRNRYALRITLDDGVVIGWDQKG